MQSLIATFRPQFWTGRDCLMPAGEPVQFDATATFLALSLEDIKSFRYNSYDSDGLACNLLARIGHSGPFEVDVNIDEWLEKNGVPDRSQMTENDLFRLRYELGIMQKAGCDACNDTGFTNEEHSNGDHVPCDHSRSEQPPLIRLDVDKDELNTILAALRWYQHSGMGQPFNRQDWLQKIACPDPGNNTSLDNDGISDLCTRLSTTAVLSVIDRVM